MKSIDITVINPSFMLAFMGTTMACLVLACGSYLWWSDLSGKLLLAAALLYLVGCFGVTIAFNVPLNNALATADALSPEGRAFWARYLSEWVFWNHIRTVAPLLTLVLLIVAMVRRGWQ